MVIHYCMLMLLTLGMHSYARNDQELFLQGNEYYKQCDITQALQHYEALEHKGKGVWVNMGNCLYHMQRYTEALVCWYRALPHVTFSERRIIRQHIAQAYKKLGKYPPPPRLWRTGQESNLMQQFIIFFEDCMESISFIGMQLIILFSWFMVFAIRRLWLANSRRRLIVRKFAFGLVILFFVGCSSLLIGKYIVFSRQVALIMHDAQVHVGPDEHFAKIDTLPEAQMISVMHEQSDWCKIKTTHGIGWIKKSDVALL